MRAWVMCPISSPYYSLNILIQQQLNKTMEELRFQQFGWANHPTTIPLLDTSSLLRYFNPGELQTRVKLSVPIVDNFRRAISTAQTNMLGFTLFYDPSIEIARPQHLWRYYVCRLPFSKNSLMSIMEASCNLLNYVRMVILQAKKAMDTYTGDYELASEIVMRSILEVEIQSNRIDELYQQSPPIKGFSSIVHYKLQQTKQDEVTVFVGFCDRAQQFVYLLLLFRETNMKRLQMPELRIDLGNIDNVVEHLVVIMRRIIGEKDFNLFGQGIRAVLETYIWQGLDSVFNRDELMRRFQENQRLLLLYECNYAYSNITNCTWRCPTEEMFSKPQSLYEFLFTVLTSRGLMLRNQDISYCSSSLYRGNGELSTIVTVEKKTSGAMIFWSTETFVNLVIDKLIAYFERKNNNEVPDPTFTKSIKSAIKLMKNSRALVKSRIEVQGDHLVAVPINIRLRHDHFANQFERLAKILEKTSFNPEYVENLLIKICNAHKAKTKKYKIKQSSNISYSKTNESVLKLCIAKTIRYLSMSPDFVAYMLQTTKGKIQSILPLITVKNPYKSDSMHYKVIRGLANKCLKRNYTAYVKQSNMEQCRSDLLYQYLCAVMEGREGIKMDIGSVSVDQEIVGLLTSQTMEKQSYLYNSLVEKLTPLIFKLPEKSEMEDLGVSRVIDKDTEFIFTIFKFLEGELRQISTQQLIYSFLGCLYFETVHGPALVKPSPQPKLSNNPYKNKTISQLTSQIKRTKILQLLKTGGLSSQMYAVHQFFDKIKPTNNQLSGIMYEVYRDFVIDNYGLEIVFKEVARSATTIDMMPVSRCIASLEEDLENLLEDKKGVVAFSVFDEDVESFILPEPTPEQLNYSITGSTRTAKDLQLNKTFQESRLIRELFIANPNTRIAGIEIKSLFTDRTMEPSKQQQVDLYDFDTVVMKVFGMKLQQAGELLALYENLKPTAYKIGELSEEERSYFNECVSKILNNEQRLKRCVDITPDLQRYLSELERAAT